MCITELLLFSLNRLLSCRKSFPVPGSQFTTRLRTSEINISVQCLTFRPIKAYYLPTISRDLIQTLFCTGKFHFI